MLSLVKIKETIVKARDVIVKIKNVMLKLFKTWNKIIVKKGETPWVRKFIQRKFVKAATSLREFSIIKEINISLTGQIPNPMNETPNITRMK